jgi:hypothetical protein
MDESKGWELRRYIILVVVLLLHVAMFAAFLITPAVRVLPAQTPHVVELLVLAPTKIPNIRSENSPPKRLSGETAISIAPPVLGSSPMSPPPSGSEGTGSGVDWSAEARRALQAFEIRSHKPASNTWNAGPSGHDNWWPRAQHRAGEQYKTDTGDWIVWINSSCYQVASATPTSAPGAVLPRTVCPGKSNAPRGDSFKEVHADEQLHQQ